MRRGFAALAAIGAVAAAAVFLVTQDFGVAPSMELQAKDAEFTKYLSKYGKQYVKKSDYEMRRGIYEASVKRAKAHNDQKGQTWFLGINKFSDMTPSEIKSTLMTPIHV